MFQSNLVFTTQKKYSWVDNSHGKPPKNTDTTWLMCFLLLVDETMSVRGRHDVIGGLHFARRPDVGIILPN